MNNYLKILLLVLVALAAIYFIPRKEDPASDYSNITNFHECEEAGFPILETFPPQCQTPDGRTFVEDLNENPEVIIETPVWGQLVASPLTVKGKARGHWFFEANLPVKLEDSNGTALAQKGMQAQTNWMTEDYVEFEGTLEFVTPQTEFGRLIIEKDNPSGISEFDASYAIPVRFR